MKWLLYILLSFSSLKAADWYASPAATAGAGTLGNPWHLQVALTNGLFAFGDTLWARGTNNGGDYRGLFDCNRHGVTVRSYPGEWARINGTGLGVLLTNIPNTPGVNLTQTVISDSEYWQVGQVIYIDTEQFQLQVRGATITNWTLVRGWAGTATNAHTSGTKVVLRSEGIISVSGSSNVFRDFEITSSMSTNRAVGSNWWIASGLNLSALGTANKAINLVVHNVGHPGIGFWQQGAGGEISGCVVFNNGNYNFLFSDAPTGSAIYSQNEQGMAFINKCINFRNFTSQGKVFGEGGPVLNFAFQSNIVFGGTSAIEGSSGSTSTSNLWYNHNVMMGSPFVSYVSLSNRATYFINNVIVNGGFALKEHADSVITNNDIFFPKNMTAVIQYPVLYSSAYYPSNALNLDWNRNRYYLGESAYGFANYQFDYTTVDVNSLASDGGGTLRFDNDAGKAWTNWSRLDVNSSYTNAWPTNFQQVYAFQNDYDATRVHVAVVNTDTNTTNATLSLSSFGYVPGQSYKLRDVQDYFAPISGVWNGSSINLPLNRTNIAAFNGTVSHITNEHTNVRFPGLFNAFVLEQQPLTTTTLLQGKMVLSGKQAWQ